jgi:hypothetical protein
VGPARSLVSSNARAVAALADALPGLERSVDRDQLGRAAARGYLRPEEEERLLDWFARLLTVREGLWQVIAEVSEPIEGDPGRIESEDEWRCFVLGYAAASAVARVDRLLVERVATDELVQRKLNEGSAELRIPRKQYTAVFESLTSPRNALEMLAAMRYAARHRARLEGLADDEQLGPVVTALAACESALDPSKRRYLEQLAGFAVHAVRRGGASARQQVTFAAMESGGRLVAELRDRWRAPRIGAERLRELGQLLRPGDVLVTRRERALSNLVLPGYWPHAALYVGSERDRARLGVELDPMRTARWSGDRCVLEALKDGVRFRPLAETLAVDAVAVLRPRLDPALIARGLGRAARHEGKPYNFDFDFLRSDRLVCTEVVYRAYDGLGSIDFELRERAGRPTLSAEDLLDMALDRDLLGVIAVLGAPPRPDQLARGPAAREALAASYRPG